MYTSIIFNEESSRYFTLLLPPYLGKECSKDVFATNDAVSCV